MGSSRQCLLSTVALTLALVGSYIQSGSTVPAYDDYKKPSEKGNKLLIFMIDGFRWDYYDEHKESLPNFQAFLEDGVQAKWVEPMTPSLSYPSWTTISTGVYPNVHQIIGNYMFDKNAKNSSEAAFRLDTLETTKLPKWWQYVEPIWITATENGKRAFTRFWSRSDIPYHGKLPEEYSGYEEGDYIDDSLQEVSDSLEIAILKFLAGFDLCMIYTDKIDTVGHRSGPDSEEMKESLIGIDTYCWDW